MKISRRSFIKIVAGLAASFSLPAAASIRKPYVEIGETVSYIGRCGYNNGVNNAFIGSRIVKEIGEWDGVGYPVKVQVHSYPPEYKTYSDVDLSNFLRDIPGDFWFNPDNQKYLNVHTYVRVKRYGETIDEAVKALNMTS